jgi:hypothetical protein
MVFWSSVLVSAALGIVSYYLIVFAERIVMPYRYLGESKTFRPRSKKEAAKA